MNQGLATKAELKRRMREGSLSFYFASNLLKPSMRDAVRILYAWCRSCDDTIDQVQDDGSKRDEGLADLRRWTHLGYYSSDATVPLEFRFLYLLRTEHQIPLELLLDLLSGMEMDLNSAEIRNEDDLLRYCYCVAGTVGMMSCHIMGVHHEAALEKAKAMGMAMQLTNIARDLRTDCTTLRRCYVPTTWLERHGMTRQSYEARLVSGLDMEKVVKIAHQLIEWSDRYYHVGMQGLIYLPFRARFAVSAARWIYGEIGANIKRLGDHAWDSRVWVRTSRKCLLLLKSGWSAVLSSFQKTEALT